LTNEVKTSVMERWLSYKVR